MGIISTDKCFITGLTANNIPSPLDAIEYSIEYNGQPFSFIFDSNVNWKEFITGKAKTMLQGMLFNNEWPIEQDTYITKTLIGNINRMVDYPSSFEKKADYYLVHCFDSGGAENRELNFDHSKYLIAYADDQDEFIRIFDLLVSKGFIFELEKRKPKGHELIKFKLTEAGRLRAKELKSQIRKIGKLNLSSGRPGIAFYYVKGDEKFGKVMEDYFSNKGFQIYPKNIAETQKDESSIRSFRSLINDEQVNYVLFIKSYKSDNNATFSNVVSMTVESHLRERKEQRRFIYIGFIDESPYDGQPRLTDYHNQMFDVRIISNRDRLLIDILSDWVKRTGAGVIPNSRKVPLKISLMKWLIRQVEITQINPVYVTFSLLKDIFDSDDELQVCLSDLSGEGLLTYTIKDNGDFYLKEYSATMMDIAPGWLAQAIRGNEKGDFKETILHKYDFPKIEIDEQEKKWMGILYEKFLNHEKVDITVLFPQFWGQFPGNFDPEKIDQKLVINGNKITLLGIWHIDPNSNIFEKCDKVIRAIKGILVEGKGSQNIKSSEIIAKEVSLTESDVLLVMELLSIMNGFMHTWGSSNIPDDLSSNLTVGDKESFQLYRNYDGMNKLMNEFYGSKVSDSIGENTKNRDEEKKKSRPNVNNTDVYHRSQIKVRDSDVEPVLGVKELASDMAEIIKEMPNEQGKMIGVFGKWGRGKSYFIKELWLAIIKKSNRDKKTYFRVDYHAWKYQDTPASWAYLYELFADAYNPKPKTRWDFIGYFVYYFKTIRLNFKRHGWSQIVKFLLSIIVFSLLSFGFLMWGNSLSNSYIPVIGIPIAFTAMSAFWVKIKNEYSTEAVRLIKKYSLKHSFKDTMGIQAEIQKELVSLLNVWIPDDLIDKNKIILFVEDVDRCSEDKIIQIIDALRIMIEDNEIAKRLIIVSAIDERVLKRAVKSKYWDLVKLDSCENAEKQNETKQHFEKLNQLTNEYLDKLFISGIKLGDLSSKERLDYFDVLIETDKEDLKSEENKVTENMPEGNIPKEGTEPYNSPLVDINTVLDSFRDDGNINFTMNQPNPENIDEKNKIGSLKLTTEEITILKKHLEKWSNTTPRKIRIFYYRYLLAKNLMMNKYLKINKKNVWQGSDLCEVFVSELIRYTDLHNPEQISDSKRQALEKIDLMSESEHFKKHEIMNSDVFELLTVLELVIAY